jgi:hypothetical protein
MAPLLGMHSSPELITSARIFLDLFQDLAGAFLLAVGDMFIDSEVSVVTFSISRVCQLGLSKVLIGVELRARGCMGECACVYVNVCNCTL